MLMAAAAMADSGGGIQWANPGANWKTQAERPMRLATYTIPAASGDAEGGECALYYFGPHQGGSVQANLDRWIGQFHNANGKPKVKTETIHGLKVTTVDVSGAYTGMGGPIAASAAASGPGKPGYRLLGAIVEGPEGSVFFKFTGPSKTVAAHQAAFDKMIQSVQPAS